MAELYLSGCVFYQLIKEATYARTSARQRKDGVKTQHSDQNIMTDLIYTFTGDRPNCPRSDVSRYRAGKIEGSVSLPFSDRSSIASYDDIVRTRYFDALNRMLEFTDRHLNPVKKDWLIKALLDVIENDESIPETDMFYVQSDGTSVSKRDMSTMLSFEYQAFLVGVLHYILTKRAGKNSLGVSTLDAITVKIQGQERKYVGHLEEESTVKVYEKEQVLDAEVISEKAILNRKQLDEGQKEASQQDRGAKSSQTQIPCTSVVQNGVHNFNIVNNNGTISVSH